MKLRPPIQGAGGKSGGGGQELPDSIRSTQMADVLDLLSEGEVEGLTFGLRSVYLDGVPLQNADDSFNFEGVQVQVTAGTQGQPSIAGADGVLSEVGVGVAVVAATPVVRSITNPAVDRVRVTIDVQQLTRQDGESGDLGGSSFGWAVDVQSNGGGFVTMLTDTVQGKTTSRYTKSIELALSGSAPWDIRVRRTSPDSTSAAEVNAFRWASYTEVQSLRLRYPNSAMVRLRVGAQQFNRIPVRSYDLMGLRVRVPSNYNTRTKVYTGVWDGTFKVEWTDCPAWIYYDLVTSTRYGLGRYFQVTPALKWRMYAIGRYCDEMVPDGKGGLEPRFRCGLYIATREQAYKMVSDLAAIFRGMAFWAGTDLAVVQDAPQDPVALFTNSNVIGGRFTYTGASHSKRHSQVVVWFNSLQEFGKLVPEVVPNRFWRAGAGIRSLELSPLGIWSRGQAQRLGKWVLYSEQREGAAVGFSVGLDGVLVQPGSVFQVADSAEAGERLGGRVRTATAAAVTLDSEVTLAAGEAYTLSCMLPDAADPARLVVQVRPVSTAAGVRQVINVSPAFTAAPAPESVWLLRSTSVEPTTWRCVGVVPAKDKPEFEIAAIRHEPEKYALIEQGITFEPAQVSRIAVLPLAPASLNFTETIYQLGQERRSKATISWPEPAPGYTYLLSWRLAKGPWTDVPPSSENCIDIDALAPGELEVSVKSRNALGSVSKPKTGTFTLVGNQVAVGGGNLVDASWWQPGAAWEWAPSFDAGVDVENAIVWGLGPRGDLQALWQATAAGTPGAGPDGGWVGNFSTGPEPKNEPRVDVSRVYRFAVPVMRMSGSGPVYWGPNDATGADSASVCALNSVTPVTNPYFHATALPASGKWYLLVGFVFPRGSTGVPASAGGVYDMATMQRVGDVTNFCWKASVSTMRTRAFQYYASAGAQVRFGKPIVELSDGTESGWTAGPRGLDGASAVTLVTTGTVTTPGPDRIRKATGVVAWDSQAYSLESFVNGAWCSWQCEQTNANLMVGLNTDPAAGADHINIDFAWFCSEGLCHIFESGGFVTTIGAYSTTDVFSVQYDGQLVRYFINGLLQRQVAAAPNLRLYLDSSFQAVGGEVRNVRFGPAGAAGARGEAGAAAQALTLLASAQAFTFNGLGVATPLGQVITLTALLANLTGSATFTATGYNAAGGSLGSLTLGGTGNSRTLTLANFGAAAYAVVQAAAGGFVDQVTLVRLKDGSDGSSGQSPVTGYLTNESHTVATAADGSGGSYGTAGGDFKVFDGTAELGAGVAFSVVAGSVVGIDGMAIGSDGVYSLTGTTADVGTATLRAVVAGVTIDKVYTISRSRQGNTGAPGTSSFVGTVYWQAGGTPTPPTGGSYNFTTSVLTPPAGWAINRPAPGVNETFSVQQTFTATTPGATVGGGAWGGLVSVAPGTAGPVTLLGNLTAFSEVNGTGPTSAAGYLELRPSGAIWGNTVDNAAGDQFSSWFLQNSTITPPGPLYQAQWTITGGDLSAADIFPAAGTWGDFPTGTGGLYVSVTASTVGSAAQARSASGSVFIKRKSDNVIVCTGSWAVGAFATNGVIS